MKVIQRICLIVIIISTNIFAQTYDVNSFLELVKKNNKNILIASKDLEKADAQKDEARAGAFPLIQSSANYSRNLKEAYMYADLGDLGGDFPGKFKINYKNEYSFDVSMVQPIFNYTVFKAIQAAKQYEKLTDYTYDATIQGIINGSKKAFYQTLLLREVYKVNIAAEKNARENYEQVKNKFDNGLVSKFEMLQAEVTWKNLIPETTKSKRNYELALNSLKSLAGISVEKDISVNGNLAEYPNKPAKVDLTDALKSRPDYNALLWEHKLRTTNIDVEMSGHFPNLFASLAYRYSATSDQFKLDRENNYLIAGLTLNIPIFSGGGVSAKIQQAKIEADQALIRIDRKKDEIYTDINNMVLKMDEAMNRITSAEVTLETARKAFQIAENSSMNGLATQLELKDARVASDQAELNYYSAVYDYLEAYFDWELAIGAI